MSNVNKIRAIIIDDSYQAVKLLRLMILELLPEIDLVGEAENVAQGFELIEALQPDLLFLDIEMPGKSGIQLAEELIAKNIQCQIIFTTAYNSYAIKAFRLSAIDYLLKPIQENQLIDAVQKVEKHLKLKQENERLSILAKNLSSDKKEVLCLPLQSGYEYIPLDEIEYLEADGSYVRVVLTNQKQKVISKNLKYFEQTLQDFPQFLRVHRSFLVNMNHLISYSKSDGGSITLLSQKVISISRERKANFLVYMDKL
jgi:two-component system LytT family response regulator